LIPLGRPLQLVLQRRGQIRVGVALELLQVRKELVACGQHFAARHVFPVLVAAALACPRKTAIANEIDEARFPAVQIAMVERLLEPDLPAQAPNAVRIDVQTVAVERSSLCQVCETMKRGDHPKHFGLPIEVRTCPRGWKVSPFGERSARGAQAIDGTVGLAAAEYGSAGAPEGSLHAAARMRERLL
jgi:hypothetical protein